MNFYSFSANPIYINPNPEITLSGSQKVSEEQLFYDGSSRLYFPSTVSMIKFGFGDGTTEQSTTATDNFYHTYDRAGAYSVTLSAYDISGNSYVDTETIAIYDRDSKRFGGNRLINLTNFLPDYLQETEVLTLVKFYEDFLNEMYDGVAGYTITDTPTASANTNYLRFVPDPDTKKISILEKIYRISELHDPDLIDIEYIQYFAKYLGYNVGISRGNVGGFGTFDVESSVCSASDNNKYLRFMVGNLPNWYQIKTTNDMIKIMLLSFGLVGDMMSYYTKDYDQNMANWVLDTNGDLSEVNDGWYPTPHFTALVDIDETVSNDNSNLLTLLMKKGELIINSIESVRPINDAFHNLGALTRENFNIYVGMNSALSLYIRIDENSGEYSDQWRTVITLQDIDGATLKWQDIDGAHDLTHIPWQSDST